MDTGATESGLIIVEGVGVDKVYLILLASYIAKGGVLTYENRPESYLQLRQNCTPLRYFDVNLVNVCRLAECSKFEGTHIPIEFTNHFNYLHRLLRLLPPMAQTWLVKIVVEYKHLGSHTLEGQESKVSPLSRFVTYYTF